jgi:hypothetical protein
MNIAATPKTTGAIQVETIAAVEVVWVNRLTANSPIALA